MKKLLLILVALAIATPVFAEITKKTVVDRMEILENGIIQVRFGLVLIEDGEEISRTYHRTSLPPGTNIDSQMIAVNNNLSDMKKETVSTTEIDKIKDHANVSWTATVVKDYQDKQILEKLDI